MRICAPQGMKRTRINTEEHRFLSVSSVFYFQDRRHEHKLSTMNDNGAQASRLQERTRRSRSYFRRDYTGKTAVPSIKNTCERTAVLRMLAVISLT